MLENCTSGIVNDGGKPLSNVVGNLLEQSKQLNSLSRSISQTRNQLVRKGGKNVSLVLAGRKRRLHEMTNEIGNKRASHVEMHTRFEVERRKFGNVTVESAMKLKGKLDSMR